MPKVILTVTDHEARALKHERVAQSLLKKGEEWSAVCFFYASLHRIKAALISDPLFDDTERLAAKNALLRPDSRLSVRHIGYFKDGRRNWGLNELVALLYKPAATQYRALFMNSVFVRYELGPEISLNRISEHATDIKIAYQQRKLVA